MNIVSVILDSMSILFFFYFSNENFKMKRQQNRVCATDSLDFIFIFNRLNPHFESL